MAKRLKRLPSNMKSALATLPSANIKRSIFQRDSDLKTTIPFDYLIPIYVDEVLPGDTFSMKLASVARLATLKVPIMDNICMTTHWFYVPNRLLWENWETFITGSDEPDQWLSNPLYSTVKNGNVHQRLVLPQHRSPQVDGYPEGSIYDYFGLPTKVPNYKHSALPLRAYELIYCEYFRDENLEEKFTYLSIKGLNGRPYDSPFTVEDLEPVLSGSETPVAPWKKGDNRPYFLRRRNKRYDYFTSALPSPQKGHEIPLTGANAPLPLKLPVHGLSLQTGYNGTLQVYPYGSAPNAGWSDLDIYDGVDAVGQTRTDGTYYSTQDQLPADKRDAWNGPGVYGTVDYQNVSGQAAQSFQKLGLITAPNGFRVHWDGDVTPSSSTVFTTPKLTADNWPLYVDTSPITKSMRADLGLTVRSLRTAIVLQQWMEKCARYGTRYVESIQGHFGVHCGDYRVQRPEYIGGTKTYINVNPIAQTSETTANRALGDLGGTGTLQDRKHVFTKSFVEHGLIIGLACITADLSYQQGVDRSPWLREDRFDFYWPTFAHIGDQAIKNKEIYCQKDDVMDSSVQLPVNELPFGYQERYAEYRYKPSKITGAFRSNAKITYDQWHLSQYFGNLPKLNREFMECKTPIDRVLALKNQPQMLLNCYFSCKSVRPIPIYSVPGLKRL